MRVDFTLEKAIEKLLESVEPPSIQPQFLLPSVLWNYNDCETDKSEGDIVTSANKHRPRMSLAICHPDGLKISSQEFANV